MSDGAINFPELVDVVSGVTVDTHRLPQDYYIPVVRALSGGDWLLAGGMYPAASRNSAVDSLSMYWLKDSYEWKLVKVTL